MSLSVLYRIVFITVLLAVARSEPIVKINQGILIGTTDGVVDQFLGIPYANPPIGDLRWQAPVYPDQFNGTYDASYFRSACYQAGPFGNYELHQSEDCLYLNVYRPATATPNSKLPVRVWIHGGGFYGGSGQIYESASLSNYSQSIIVTINYRVNIFGFMVLPGLIQESTTLNYGLLDQQFALKWIQQNIGMFGGNPDKVMINGESAGGMSVLLHNLMPQSWSLFDTSVIQSAGPWTFFTAQKVSSLNVQAIKQANMCQSANQTDAELVTCLRALPSRDILQLLQHHVIALPVIDDVQLLDTPLALIQHGQNRPGRIIFGQTDQEGNLFAYNLVPSMSLNASTFNTYVNMYALPSESVAYQDVIDEQGYWLAMSAIMRDYYITCGTYFAVQYLSENLDTTVYSYLFTHHTHNWKYRALNATHEAELAYVFHNNFDATMFDSSEELLSQQIVDLWTSFHVYGDPSKNNYGINWTPYKFIVMPSFLDVDVPLPTLNQEHRLVVIQDGQSLLQWSPPTIQKDLYLPNGDLSYTKQVLLRTDSNITNWTFTGDCLGISKRFTGDPHWIDAFITVNTSIFTQSVNESCALEVTNENGDHATLEIDLNIYDRDCRHKQNGTEFCVYLHNSIHSYCNTTTGECLCEQDYFGFNCSYCTANETCNGHGRCSAWDGSCLCDKHYYGEDCSKYCEMYDTCNGHGYCPSNGTCDCMIGYYGSHCEISCDTDTCHGHGTCSSNGTCICYNGHYGEYCQYTECITEWGHQCEHGTCSNRTGLCDCDPEYYGRWCDKYCGPDSCQGHGACDRNGYCVCDKYYYGYRCNKYCGPQTCSYGDCDGQGQCHCNATKCIFGKCDGDSCVCQQGYYGPQCNQQCHSCQNGYCDKLNGTCICDANYYSPDCSVYCLSNTTCSGHGACDFLGKCTCDSGFSGETCSNSPL